MTITTEALRNIAVAGHGTTGKTSLLVERLVHLALSGEVSLERVTAITFTEKAAAEMKERVAWTLEEVARATPSDPRAPRENGEADRVLRDVPEDDHSRIHVQAVFVRHKTHCTYVNLPAFYCMIKYDSVIVKLRSAII